MTKLVRVKPETYELLNEYIPAGRMLHPFESKVVEDGLVEFPLDDHTWSRLQQYREPGEDDNTFLHRLLIQYSPMRNP